MMDLAAVSRVDNNSNTRTQMSPNQVVVDSADTQDRANRHSATTLSERVPCPRSCPIPNLASDRLASERMTIWAPSLAASSAFLQTLSSADSKALPLTFSTGIVMSTTRELHPFGNKRSAAMFLGQGDHFAIHHVRLGPRTDLGVRMGEPIDRRRAPFSQSDARMLPSGPMGHVNEKMILSRIGSIGGFVTCAKLPERLVTGLVPPFNGFRTVA